MFDQDFIKLSPRYCEPSWVCSPQRKDQRLLVFVCPHGGEGEKFLEDYQLIFSSFQGKKRSLFLDYLDIEQDKGAWEWTNEICSQMKRENQDVAILKILFNFPRGILDGGRKVEHCVGGMLPQNILEQYSQEWENIQSDIIEYMEKIYQEVRRTCGLLLDLHTMAPTCRSEEVPRTYAFLESYLTSYLVMDGPERSWDLIIGEQNGEILADKRMVELMCESLEETGVAYKVNHPYPAAPAYLMHLHMSKCPTIAIDIPKTELSTKGQDWNLKHFHIDSKRLQICAEVVVRALKKWVSHV